MNLELVEKLTQTFGPSGYEDEIRALIQNEISELADEIYIDPLGSLVAHRKGAGKKVILAAHMDEIGIMITHVEKKGFLRFTTLGGQRTINRVGQRVRFADGTIGVVYVERLEDNSKMPSFKNLYIDIGATSRETCPLHVGDPGVFVGPLVSQNGRIVSKTLDDRIGCYILIEIMRQLKDSPYDLYFVFTTQEEITLSGARTSAFRIDPDIAISIDVTGTGDTPKALPMAVELGQGPAVKIKDGGMVAHPLVRNMLIQAAQKDNLPYQMEILLGGTTDAAVMQLVRAGVPSGCLSIPCRFIHSTAEMIATQDVENAIKIFLNALETT